MLIAGNWGLPGSGKAADHCTDFYDTLSEVPHSLLEQSSQGTFISVLDGRSKAGCSIRFETTEALLVDGALPDLRAAPGSTLAAIGWSVDPSTEADGPGSSIHALTRGDVQCVVSWAQPSFVDDDGEFVVSETITVVIQCEDSAGLNALGSLPNKELPLSARAPRTASGTLRRLCADGCGSPRRCLASDPGVRVLDEDLRGAADEDLLDMGDRVFLAMVGERVEYQRSGSLLRVLGSR